MTSKNLKKYINDNVKEYYHSSGLYNSLIYKKVSQSNNLSKEQSLEKNFSKIRIALEKFIDNKNDLIKYNIQRYKLIAEYKTGKIKEVDFVVRVKNFASFNKLSEIYLNE